MRNVQNIATNNIRINAQATEYDFTEKQETNSVQNGQAFANERKCRLPKRGTERVVDGKVEKLFAMIVDQESIDADYYEPGTLRREKIGSRRFWCQLMWLDLNTYREMDKIPRSAHHGRGRRWHNLLSSS